MLPIKLILLRLISDRWYDTTLKFIYRVTGMAISEKKNYHIVRIFVKVSMHNSTH